MVVMGVGMVGQAERGDPRPRPRQAEKVEGSRLVDKVPWKRTGDGTVATAPICLCADVYESSQNHLIISFPSLLSR